MEVSPDTSILVGCGNDGWFSVSKQIISNMREFKLLLCTLGTQIYSLFSTFQKGDISQPTFLYLETCIQRFIIVLKEFLQAQENFALVLEDKSKKDGWPKDTGLPLWEEAKTRNKFDVESPKTLTKGTVNSLIEALTDVTVVESEFNSILFLTYRSYLHPRALLAKLFERFNVPKEFSRQSSRIQFRTLVAVREFVKICVCYFIISSIIFFKTILKFWNYKG